MAFVVCVCTEEMYLNPGEKKKKRKGEKKKQPTDSHQSGPIYKIFLNMVQDSRC